MKITIEGKTGEGKTLVANAIKEYLRSKYIQGPLKEVHVKQMYSKDIASLPLHWRKDRDVLIVIKTTH